MADREIDREEKRAREAEKKASESSEARAPSQSRGRGGSEPKASTKAARAAGISRDEAKDAKRMASVPEPLFEEAVARAANVVNFAERRRAREVQP